MTLVETLEQHAADAIESAGFFLFVALFTAMAAMQFFKAVVKLYLPYKFRKHSRWAFFAIAYLIGYQAGRYFLEGPDAHKWAVFVGFINPIFYFALVQLAAHKRWTVLLSILKMRTVDHTNFDDTGKWMRK